MICIIFGPIRGRYLCFPIPYYYSCSLSIFSCSCITKWNLRSSFKQNLYCSIGMDKIYGTLTALKHPNQWVLYLPACSNSGNASVTLKKSHCVSYKIRRPSMKIKRKTKTQTNNSPQSLLYTLTRHLKMPSKQHSRPQALQNGCLYSDKILSPGLPGLLQNDSL